MSLSRACLAIIGLAFLQPAARAAEGAAHPGKALYERHCASCHDKPDVSRAVPFAQLRTMPLGNEARVFAIDTSGDAPCFAWVYESSVPLRTGAAYGVLASGQPVLAFADAAVNVHLLDARTGKLLWKTPVGRWD